MQIYCFEEYRRMAEAATEGLNIEIASFSVDRFPNHELHASIGSDDVSADCMVFGSISPKDENLLSTLLLCHTLKLHGAKRIIAVVPYLAYTRQDKRAPGKCLGAAWIGELMQASGISELVCVDVHSHNDGDLIKLPIISLSPATLFAKEIERQSLQDAVIVAPDEGARDRCGKVHTAAGMTKPLVYFKKVRSEAGIKHLSLQGNVESRVVIIDDILDSGATLASCCELLQSAGAREITIMVTHGLFTGEEWRKLERTGVRNIVCTDTSPATIPKSSFIESVSIAPLLREYLARV